MLKQALCEARLTPELSEIRQPALKLVKGGGSDKPSYVLERRLRRERRQAANGFRAASGWRIGTW